LPGFWTTSFDPGFRQIQSGSNAYLKKEEAGVGALSPASLFHKYARAPHAKIATVGIGSGTAQTKGRPVRGPFASSVL
jgi:hypothetical protein